MVAFPSWTEKYVGIPFVLRGRSIEGADCWGLFALILKEQFGIEIPAHDTDHYEELAAKERWKRLAALIVEQREREKQIWIPIDICDATIGDDLILRMLNLPLHVSFVVAPGWMIHTELGIDSVLENFERSNWKNRILGAYRHEQIASHS